MTELIDVCGGSVTADFQVRSTVKGRVFKTVTLQFQFSVFLINLISCYGRVISVCRNVQKQKNLILKINYKTHWQQR